MEQVGTVLDNLMCTVLTVPRMLCVKPLRRPGREFGCGQCLPCRINRARMWCARLTLEMLAHEEAVFVTRTLDDANCWRVLNVEEVGRTHRNWSKDLGFRYFTVFEYGERTQRPHFHDVLFGVSVDAASGMVAERWRYGLSQVWPFDVGGHGRYITGYVTKKWTRPEADGLAGRPPERVWMSRRPALGWPGVDFMVRWLASPVGQDWMARNHDVPQAISLDRRLFPLGRTMVRKLRELLDLPERDEARDAMNRARVEAVQLDEVLAKKRELTRYGAYDRMVARRTVKGTL